MFSFDFIAGKPFTAADSESGLPKVVLSASVARNLFCLLYPSEFVSLMGPSGCGKSTLLNIMGLLDAPSSGKIEINGTSVESMKDKELRCV